MTLRARLTLGFVATALLLAIPLAVALRALHAADRAADTLRNRDVAASLLLGRMRGTTQALDEAEAWVLVVPDMPHSADSLDRRALLLGVQADSLRALGLAEVADTIVAAARTVRTYGRVEAAAVSDGEKELADRTSESRTRPTIAAVARLLTDAEQRVRESARVHAEEVSAAVGSAYRLAALLVVFAALGALAVAVWITRSISRPMRELERGMGAVAAGNFDHRLVIAPERNDEFGRLAGSFQSMTGQLAELDKMKAEFISVASHELKTPINVILGYLKLLEENLYGPVNERQSEVIKTLEGQAQSLSRLTQHLLDVSRFEAGAGGLDLRPLGLRAFLAQVEETYGVLAAQREIAFAVSAGADVPEVVTWDADRMHEVLGNLLTNAFKFTEPGGRVDLAVSGLHGAVYLEVRDNGAGIGPEQVPHIFDKFYQADNQSAAATKGSGLGLAITKEIVEAHDGSIAVESRRGEGTKFSLVVPVHPKGTGADGADGAADAEAGADEASPAGVGR